MLSRCRHCRDVGKPATVRCLKGLFGGLPHIGVCRSRCPDCTDYAPARSAGGPAEPGYVRDRKRICEACEFRDTVRCQLPHRPCERRRYICDPGEACPMYPPKWGPRPPEAGND